MADPAAKQSKDDLARERLTPLGEGERPRAVTVAAGVALVIAVANVVLLAAGAEVKGAKPNTFGALSFAAIMLLAAYGLWRSLYWAVLGFQALLAIVLLLTALSLFLASSVWAGAAEVIVLGLAGTLFWFMVKALARIQMPEQRGPSGPPPPSG